MLSIFETGADGVRKLDEAVDIHDAVGLWWAHALLSGRFDIRYGPETQEASRLRINHEREWAIAADQRLPFLRSHAGAFAGVVRQISEETDEHLLAVHECEPGLALQRALYSESLPTIFKSALLPWASYTYRLEDGSGRALAKLGASGQQMRIWPPVPGS